MKTKYFALFTVIASSCSFIALCADEAPRPPAPEGRRPDGPPQGGDPKARIEEALKHMDTNGDGSISKDEFVDHATKEAGERFAKMDTNGDGSISKAEVEEMAGKMRGMKHDGEGRPEGGFRRPEGDARRPEGEANNNGARPRPDGDKGQTQPPRGDRPEGFRRPGGDAGPPAGSAGAMMGEMIKRMDKNGDGVITREEYISSNEERFNQMDENKDGKVTKDELEAMGRRMREMMGGGDKEGGFRRPEGEGNGTRPRPQGDAPRPKDGV